MAESAQYQYVDFRRYKDGTELGKQFTIDGFSITAAGDKPLIVKVDSGIHKLQFGKDGIQIDLPRESTSSVTLATGSYSSQPLEIKAADAHAQVIDGLIVPADSSLHTRTLYGASIAWVKITGGQNKGVLVLMALDGR